MTFRPETIKTNMRTYETTRAIGDGIPALYHISYNGVADDEAFITRMYLANER